MPSLIIRETINVVETIIEDETNRIAYKVVTNDQDPSFQVFKAELVMEETGDAENGPQLDSHWGKWESLDDDGWSLKFNQDPMELLQETLKRIDKKGF